MGGGVMRTAARVGIASGAAAAAAGGRFRHAAPAFATAPAAEAAAAGPLVSAAGEVPAAAAPGAQWASWEMDDWEFADRRDAAVAEAEETVVGKPRLVFAPPSLEEAEEATTELRDALERSVVASLASDKNVWDAVVNNKKVMEFYKTHQQTLVHTFPEDTTTTESPENASPFSDFVGNAKKRVIQIVDNITNFFQDMFRNQSEEGSSHSFAEFAGGSFLALAIAVILVVLFKRA